jgi:hypothetical protein
MKEMRIWGRVDRIERARNALWWENHLCEQKGRKGEVVPVLNWLSNKL